ncbi:hypothetical protein HanIR_Chr07g0325111 [Helianthus annuus]|nr:hypothetical protein HanIR_Chr07g0325111 [Helianthus annuus]
MVLRGGRYLLDRRFADRCNDRSMFVSRARGEDRYPVRRTADRGNDRVDSDPRDLKIMRLRQRVRDLELQHEIIRLKQRIRDLEDSSLWKETEPEKPVRDELSGDEEHATNGDIIYDSPPVYDEYGDDEWYSWVTDGDRNLPGVMVENRGDTIASGGSMAVTNGLTASDGSQSQFVVCSSFMPEETGFQKEGVFSSKIQGEKEIRIAKLAGNSNQHIDINLADPHIIMNFQKGIDILTKDNIMYNDKDFLEDKEECIDPMHENITLWAST